MIKIKRRSEQKKEDTWDLESIYPTKDEFNADANLVKENTTKLEEYKGKDILIYCSIGRRSAKAAGILIDNGYTNVYNVVDGVTEYDFKLVK